MLHTFTQGKCTFGEMCNIFREYLLTAPQGLHKNRKLHVNSAANYWSTFRASIHTAYRYHKIKENPNGFLERIETIPTDKEHLSQDEVIRLASTPCSAPALKRAFLFSCLTALRKSDIKKLTWEEIQPYGSDGVMYVANQNHLLLIFLFSIRIVCADGPLPQLSLFPIGVPSETSIKNIIVPLIASDIVAETTIVPIYLNKNGISNKKDTKMDITYTINQSL